MRIRVIWDYGRVQIWRSGSRGTECLASGQASDGLALTVFLEAHYRFLAGSRLTVLVDHPHLDHRLERMPRLSRRMQHQLLEQRLQKSYGTESRSWAALILPEQEAGMQELRLVASLPKDLISPLAAWAFKVGLYLEGVFSLPAALAKVTPEQASPEGRILSVQAGDVSYLVAQNPQGKLLFFLRVGERPDDAQRERSAGRLALFVEQEFGLRPLLQKVIEEDSGGEMPSGLFSLPSKVMLNLCPSGERRRQIMLRMRMRSFAALVIILMLSFLHIQPKLAEGQTLRVRQQELSSEIREVLSDLQIVQSALTEGRTLRQVVAFCRNRLEEREEDPVPSPIPVLVAGICDALPRDLELDRIECQIDTEESLLKVHMKGRPLSPDLDLATQLERFGKSLDSQGWAIDQTEINFVQEGSDNSRFSRRGAQRFFEMDIIISPRVIDLETL